MVPKNQGHTVGGDEDQTYPRTLNPHTYVPVDPFKPSIAYSLRTLSAEEDANLLEDNRPPIRNPRFQGTRAGASKPRTHRFMSGLVPTQQVAAKSAWRPIPPRSRPSSAHAHVPDTNSERDKRRVVERRSSPARYGGVGGHSQRSRSRESSRSREWVRDDSHRRSAASPRDDTDKLSISARSSRISGLLVPDIQYFQYQPTTPQSSIPDSNEIEHEQAPSRYEGRGPSIEFPHGPEDRKSRSSVVSPVEGSLERYASRLPSRIADEHLSAASGDSFFERSPPSKRSHPRLRSELPPPEIDVSVYGAPDHDRNRSGSLPDSASYCERFRSSSRRRSRSPPSVRPIVSSGQPTPRPPIVLADLHPTAPRPVNFEQTQKYAPSLESLPSPYMPPSLSLLPSMTSIPLRRRLQLRLSTSYAAAFLIDTLPRQIYLNLLLRLPYLYFSRVTRIFEEAEMSMPMIRQGILDAARANAKARGDDGVFSPSAKARMLGGAWGVELEPSTDNVGYCNLQTTWLAFIDALLKEWKTLNIISVLLLSRAYILFTSCIYRYSPFFEVSGAYIHLTYWISLSSAILTILQIESAASDPLTRYTALLSMICALISLVYGCIYIIRFGTMKKTYKGAAWAQEAQRQKTGIWWNIWVMLALPATWLAWSLILYIMTIVSFVWRTSPFQNSTQPTILPSPTSPELLVPRVLITAVVSMGIIYFVLIAFTLQRYGETMDRAWQERIWTWMQNAHESDVVDVVDAPHQARSWTTWKPEKEESEEDVMEKEQDLNAWGNGSGRPENLSRDSNLKSIPRWQGDVEKANKNDDRIYVAFGDHIMLLEEPANFPSEPERLEKKGESGQMTMSINGPQNMTSTVTVPLPLSADPVPITWNASRVSLIANASYGTGSSHEENVVASGIPELSSNDILPASVTPPQDPRIGSNSPSEENIQVFSDTRAKGSPKPEQPLVKLGSSVSSSPSQLATPTSRTFPGLSLRKRSLDLEPRSEDINSHLQEDDIYTTQEGNAPRNVSSSKLAGSTLSRNNDGDSGRSSNPITDPHLSHHSLNSNPHELDDVERNLTPVVSQAT